MSLEKQIFQFGLNRINLLSFRGKGGLVLEIIDGLKEIDFRFNQQGLMPAVVQDYQTKEVLMVAYVNEESLNLSLEKGQTVFYSRTRQEI